MIVRRLDEEDAEEFRALRLHALRESPEAFGSSYEETIQQPAATLTERLRANPDAPHNFFLGAFDPAMIGMVGFHRESRLKTWHKGSIISMYVAAEARGHGVGRALLEQAIVEARKQPDLEQVLLAVVSANQAAKRLYTALGFEVYGVEPRGLKLGDRYYDEDLMILDLRVAGRLPRP